MTDLFQPFSTRSLTLKNRFTVAPMCQYSARGGMPNDWHLVHLGRFALGGFALVTAEATAVTAEGRITYGDTGIWSDDHIAPWRRIVDFLHANGAKAGIQLAHAGRKASTPLPWRKGFDETEAEKRDNGFEAWTPVAPSAEPHAEGQLMPHELSATEIERTVDAFAAAARRAEAAGFDLVEIHGAHGYLINQFLSPIANHRTDNWGGSEENRMRFPLAVVEAVRAAWPKDKPLFMRISATDWREDGLHVEDTARFVEAAAKHGVDVVHCSSGGFAGAAVKPGPNYQVPLAAEIRKRTGVPTIAVGLITTPQDAAGIIARGDADLVALARPALDDPNFPLHARRELRGEPGDYDAWPKQEGYAIRAMDRTLERV